MEDKQPAQETFPENFADLKGFWDTHSSCDSALRAELAIWDSLSDEALLDLEDNIE